MYNLKLYGAEPYLKSYGVFTEKMTEFKISSLMGKKKLNFDVLFWVFKVILEILKYILCYQFLRKNLGFIKGAYSLKCTDAPGSEKSPPFGWTW